MEYEAPKSTCQLCGSKYARKGITRHIKSCVPKNLKILPIIARNAQPIIPCDECSAKPAVEICTACVWNDEGWLCEECAKNHECDEDMFLPVVNSPRTGVCGYTGE